MTIHMSHCSPEEIARERQVYIEGPENKLKTSCASLADDDGVQVAMATFPSKATLATSKCSSTSFALTCTSV